MQVAALLVAPSARPLLAAHVHASVAPVPAEAKLELQVHVLARPVEEAPTGQAEHVSALPVRPFV